jgi:hypothetical protein
LQHLRGVSGEGGELSNYAPADHLGVPVAHADGIIAGSLPHNSDVALRSQPAKITPIRSPRTGSLSFRVTVTINGHQRKRHFRDLNDAKAQQEDWEIERTLAASAPQPKNTRLTYEELREAEAADLMLNGSGYNADRRAE